MSVESEKKIENIENPKDSNQLFETVFKVFFEKIGFKGNQKSKVKILLFVLLLGCVMMIFGSCQNEKAATSGNSDMSSKVGFSVISEEKELEEKLENILSKIKGVGNVDVSVMLATGSRTEYAIDTGTTVNTTEELTSDGGKKNMTQRTDNKSVVFENTEDKPVIVQESRAEVQGVLVVADGGDDAEVCKQIISAVSDLLGIPVHKITVCATEK